MCLCLRQHGSGGRNGTWSITSADILESWYYRMCRFVKSLRGVEVSTTTIFGERCSGVSFPDIFRPSSQLCS